MEMGNEQRAMSNGQWQRAMSNEQGGKREGAYNLAFKEVLDLFQEFVGHFFFSFPLLFFSFLSLGFRPLHSDFDFGLDGSGGQYTAVMLF